MKNITTRKATLSDINALQKIGELTFIKTYASQNSKENMSAYLKKNFSIESLKTQLTNKNSEFHFAIQDDKIIGYLKINSKQPKVDTTNKNALEIERIYVLHEYQGKKIGVLLLQEAIAISKQINADYIWLGVWEENLKAIQFYNKNGFIEHDRHVFKLGNEVQSDIIMKLDLN
jgi:ribosomal protein S18 acetylase RimI-like enzyme|nr:GNAT family N-acetyltransferase [uncultured Psychroserpens sp.]